MQMSMIVRRAFVFAACVGLLAACPGKKGDGAGSAKMDTTNAQWEDGLSAEQVQDSARALSPEEAARMGLAVDTSIHLEQLESRDSLGGAQPTPAPSEGGSGATDTVPAAAARPGATPPAGTTP